MIELHSIIGYLIVSLLWGCTNPFIKHAQSRPTIPENNANGSANGLLTSGNQSKGKSSYFMENLQKVKKAVQNIRFVVPFILNQSGSMVFFFLLSTEPVSVASPVCNSLTFLFTALTSLIIFKEYVRYPWMLLIGTIFILLGTYLCL